MLNPARPFTSTGFRHRERNFTIDELRKQRKFVYILTDIRPFQDLELAVKSDGVLESLDELDDAKIGQSAFYVYFSVDEKAVAPIQHIVRCGGLFIPPMQFSKTTYPRVAQFVEDTLVESDGAVGGLFGERQLHENICQAVDMTRDVEGDFLEVGVFTGSSAVVAMTHMRNRGMRRKCFLMDTFEGFTYAEAEDSADGIWSGTHLMAAAQQQALLTQRMRNCGQDFRLVKGNICAVPIPAEIGKLALVNVDVDMYEATLAVLTKAAPLVQPRGVMVCEDPASTPGLYGAFIAMDEFLNSAEGRKFVRVFMGTQYFLIKMSL
ncbi:MAG: class I SAM-dependent methyltransferase [Proteobacteria bacterium]|nr:class I SAM-dependent methyltransferase [Pseudomonadota bacterium]